MKDMLRMTLFLVIISSILTGQTSIASNFSFTQIGLQQEMPSYVNYVYEESNGIVWLDTSSGLIRYDGKDLKYYAIPIIRSTNNYKRILQIIEDQKHQLWFLTVNGLVRYSKTNDNFTPCYTANGQELISAGAVCRTQDGLIFGGTDKLYKYSYETDEINVLTELDYKEDFFIQRMKFWDPHTLICSNREKDILLFDIDNKKILPTSFSKTNNYADFCIDNEGNLWITDYNNGLKRYSREGELTTHYTSKNSSLSSDLVLCLTLIKGKIWAGTDGGGINIIDPKDGSVQVLKHESGNIHSLPVNTILHIHGSQKSNNIWLGTTRGGLINIRETNMVTFSSVSLGNDKGLSENTVLSLYQEPNSSTIWIGTDGGGINCLDENTNKIKHYPNTWDDKVVSICGYSDQELLVSIFSQGLFLFNKITGAKRPFQLSQTKLDNYIKYSRLSTNLYNETPDNILLLTNPIARYHIPTGQTTEIVNTSHNIPQGILCNIAEDSIYSYYHNTQDIYKIKKGGTELLPVFHSDTAYYINSAAMDSKGDFWIVGSTGLSTINNGKLTHINCSLFKEAKSILCDDKGRIWIGAGQDLYSYHPKEQKFILYGESDGLQRNEYLQKPKLLSTHKRVYMGGVNGLLCINADTDTIAPTDEKDATVILLDFTVGDENQLYKVKDGKIALPWNTRNIRLRFLVAGDDVLRPRLFHYTLDNQQENAISSYDTELNIPSLASGTYPICVSYTKKDGGWSKPQRVLTLVILPPWYKSWWFVTLMCLLCLFAIYLTIKAALKKKDNRIKWMLKEREQEIYEEKVRFLINISHELRTPLTLIYAPLKKIIDSIQPTDRYFKQLNLAFKQAQRMKDLISMVLDARKMEMTATHLNVQSYNLNQWVKEVCDNFEGEESDEKKIELQLDENIGQVDFDREKCIVILSNLLMNALKHSPKKSTIRIQTEFTDDKKGVRISVSDEGEGLKNVDPDKLFVRFYQGSNEQSGSGIGLSYSKILVELHKGKIGAYNNPERGATFYFELPLTPNASSAVPQNNSYLNELLSAQSSIEIDMPDKEKINTVSLKENTILVVDDNTNLVEYLADELKEIFKHVFVAYDGETAYKIAREESPDIIVSDVMMPGMNGYELCKAIKEDITVSHIPIILLTARNDETSRQYGYMLGADSYLKKPFEMDKLLNKVVNKLYNRAQTRRHYQQVGEPEIQVPESDLTQKDTLFMDKLNQVIIDNLDNTALDIPFLCKQIGMSRASLYNKLKAITDMGANDYINKIRIEQAMVLIAEGNLNFTEISEKVGFASPRYFSTSFKQYTGKTPTQYKKDNGQGA